MEKLKEKISGSANIANQNSNYKAKSSSDITMTVNQTAPPKTSHGYKDSLSSLLAEP
jgi:hypothetical protein